MSDVFSQLIMDDPHEVLRDQPPEGDQIYRNRKNIETMQTDFETRITALEVNKYTVIVPTDFYNDSGNSTNWTLSTDTQVLGYEATTNYDDYVYIYVPISTKTLAVMLEVQGKAAGFNFTPEAQIEYRNSAGSWTLSSEFTFTQIDNGNTEEQQQWAYFTPSSSLVYRIRVSTSNSVGGAGYLRVTQVQIAETQ
jgi:hypothetical protein